MRVLTTTLLAAVCAAGLLSAGCDRSQPERARPADEVRTELQHLYEVTWGSQRARQAMEVSAYVGFHERVASCLAADGWRHTAGAFLDAAVPPGTPLAWWPALLPIDRQHAQANDFTAPAPTIREPKPARRWPGKVPPGSARAACESKAVVPVNVPAVDPDLDRQLYEVVKAAVEASPSASRAAYATCMTAKGVAIPESREKLVAQFQQQRSANASPPTEERVAAIADVDCRADGYHAVMLHLDQPLSAFAQRNAQRLRDLETVPDELQEQAKLAAQRIDLSITWM